MSCNIACITSQRPPQRPKDVVCRITRRGALPCIGAALCVLNYRRHCHSFCVLLLARIVGHSCVWLVHTECTRMLFVVMDVSLVCTAVSARSLHHLHIIFGLTCCCPSVQNRANCCSYLALMPGCWHAMQSFHSSSLRTSRCCYCWAIVQMCLSLCWRVYLLADGSRHTKSCNCKLDSHVRVRVICQQTRPHYEQEQTWLCSKDMHHCVQTQLGLQGQGPGW